MRNHLAQPSSLSSLQDECLKLLTGMFNVSKAASYMVDRRSNIFSVKSYYVQPGMQREYIERFYQYDPLHPSNLTDTTTFVRRTNEIIATDERLKHPYYCDFLNRWGVHDTVEIYLRSDERIVAGFSLFFADKQEELQNLDMRKLEQLHRFMEFSLNAFILSQPHQDFDTICDEYHFTAKERLVVDQVLQGLPNKSIANNLCCSLATVKWHLQNIFEKMGVNSKAEIVSLFFLKR